MTSKHCVYAIAMIAATSAAGMAGAATISFTNFSSSNSHQLSPTVTVNDDTAGQFDVSVSISAPDVGSLVGLFMEVDNATISEADIFNESFSHIGFAQNTQTLSPDVNLNGLTNHPFTFALEYDKDDQIGLVALTFSIVDMGYSLMDFSMVGLRFKESNNNAGQTGNDESDKLFSSTTIAPPPVPLPAAGWLLMGALGGLAAMRRVKKS